MPHPRSSRVVCLWIPGFPIAVHARDATPAKGSPIALVRGEGTHARVVAINQAARVRGLRVGMHPSRGRALVAGLQVVAVAELDIAQATRALEEALAHHAPSVSSAAPGAFWLEPFCASTSTGERDFAHTLIVTVGMQHFSDVRVGIADAAITASAASKRAPRGGVVRVPPGKDAAFLAPLPSTLLPLRPELHRLLHALGITTIGDIQAMHVATFERRFAAEGRRVWALAWGKDPRRARTPALQVPHQITVPLLTSCIQREPILFVLRGAIHRLARSVAGAGLAIARFRIVLRAAGSDARRLEVTPSQPTAAAALLFTLAKSALAERNDASGREDSELGPLEDGSPLAIDEVMVEIVATAPLHPHQGDLFQRLWRDPVAAESVRVRLSQRFGDAALRVPCRSAQRRPEGDGFWGEATPRGAVEARASSREPGLQRELNACMRLLERPEPIGVIEAGEPPRRFTCSGFLPACRVRAESEVEVSSGEWWASSYDRRYFWCLTEEAQLLWIYQDRASRQWFLHGWLD